jgi:hypothetical protein
MHDSPPSHTALVTHCAHHFESCFRACFDVCVSHALVVSDRPGPDTQYALNHLVEEVDKRGFQVAR